MKRKFTLWFICLISLVFAANATSIDLAVVQSDMQQCDTAGLTTMYIKIKSMSSVPLSAGEQFTANYKVNNASVVSQNFTITSIMNPGDSAVFAFTTKYNFNQFATYNCKYFISNSSDINSLNDTVAFQRTFYSYPSYGNHSSDTAVCKGSNATLMMELNGFGPWYIDIIMGGDSILGLPVPDSVISLTAPFEETSTFTLLNMMDSHGCATVIGQSITIAVYDTLLINLGSDTTLCANKSIMLNAGNYDGATYLWQDASSAQTFLADTNVWNGVLGTHEIYVSVAQAACSGTDTINVEFVICPDGISENSKLDFNVYPNPANDFLTLYFPNPVSNATLYIESVLGEIIYSEKLSNEFSGAKNIDLSNLPEGMYLAVVNNGQTNTVKRVVVTR